MVVEKFTISTEIAVYLGNGTRQAHGYYGSLSGIHRWRINLCLFRWPWVTLKGGKRGVKIFRLIYTLVLFDLERPHFGKVTHVGQSVFLRGHPCPRPNGVGSSVPEIFLTYMRAHTVW